ncbi:MAG: ZIP family metal transporter [Ruminococcaceae bacterium]|nr:ZIP family metal transporter [Oscillospiraceae bacterium]
MNNITLSAVGIMIPLLGTTIGAAMVLLLRRSPDSRVQKALLGCASGVMIAASVWSLLLPAIEMTEQRGGVPWLPAVTGFLTGVAVLMLLDRILPCCDTADEGDHGSRMLTLAVTLHNIPEGMAVGVAFAGALSPDAGIPMAEAMILAVGIAIQNLPEGMIISMPMAGTGTKKGRAFASGFLSGVVEPIGAAITLLVTSLIVPVLPFILSFAAGAMIFVVINELIPEAQSGKGGCWGVCGAALGFSLMMLLDVALG